MTELGAAEIVPVRAARCVARPDDADAKLERWERIIERSVAQCRGAAPRVHAPVSLGDWLAGCSATLRLICAAEPDAVPILDILAAADDTVLSSKARQGTRTNEFVRATQDAYNHDIFNHRTDGNQDISTHGNQGTDGNHNTDGTDSTHENQLNASGGVCDEIAILIGPEGDFAPEEIAAACEAGFKPAGLGPRVLRSETAAAVALAAVMLYNDQGKNENR